jgi:hypothetical protein
MSQNGLPTEGLTWDERKTIRRRITNDQKQIKEYIEMIFNIVTEKYNLRHEMILPEQF